MANVLAPFGFRPIRYVNGSPWNGQLNRRMIVNGFATSIYRGDVVQSLTTGYISRFAAAQVVSAGIFMGCFYFDNVQGKRIYSNRYPASVSATGDITAEVMDDPNVIMEVQVTGATPVTFEDIGENVDILATAGDNLSGISKESVDVATVGVTATLPFRIVGRSDAVDNDNVTLNNRIYVIGNTFDRLARLGV